MAATSEATQALKGVFPDSHLSLKEADPEAFAIIELEKERQWCATRSRRLHVRRKLPSMACGVR